MGDAATIARALGGARKAGCGWVARCPAHGDRNPSLSLTNGRDGRLLARCHAGCDWPVILDALRALGLVEGTSDWRPPSREELAAQRAAEAQEEAKRAAQARQCWDEALPAAGSLVERYLRGRGITSPIPDVLRFHPDCWHGPTARRFPAMLARVDGCERFAVHRTYLSPEGRKAAVEPAKMSLGSVGGGAVRLYGAHRRLVVAEGIETALSLTSGLLDGPASVWAALSAPGMAALRLPPLPSAGAELVVAVDGDPTGRRAGRELAERATAAGWRVSMADPGDGADFNDILTEAAT